MYYLFTIGLFYIVVRPRAGVVKPSYTLLVLRAWAQRVEIIALLIYDAGLQPTKQQREAISMARQEEQGHAPSDHH